MVKLRKLRNFEDDDDELPGLADTIGQPVWMTIIKTNAEGWLGTLPEALLSTPNDDSPLARFFTREIGTGQTLLAKVRKDLSEVVQVCDGVLKQTNEMRVLLSDLNKGECSKEPSNVCMLIVSGSVPSPWLRFRLPRNIAVGQFISNLAARMGQLQVIASKQYKVPAIWLGGLFSPEAYLTATRQTVAHQKGWSLEQLELKLDVQETVGTEVFVVHGEHLQAVRVRTKLMI
jgi:dynein heavy chain 1